MKPGPKPIPELHRFWRVVQMGPGCWEWTGLLNDYGYGRFSRHDRTDIRAHRFMWMIFNGDPGELFVCHTCDNPRCVNPFHLFLGTNADNMRDCKAKGRNRAPLAEHFAAKTHCPHGHPYAGDNLVIEVHKNGVRNRICRICRNAKAARRRLAKRQLPMVVGA